MRRFLIHLSYFGTRYRGFQKQNFNGDPKYEDPHTICGLLEIGLKGCVPNNHPVVVPSSRTDKGVHALCNTVHVDLDEDLANRHLISSQSIVAYLNYFFKHNDHDIRVLCAQQVSNDFHCRYKAIEREYLYRIAVPKPGVPFRQRNTIPTPITELSRCWFLQNSMFDSQAVKDACDVFIGTKDFRALCSKSRDVKPTIRTLNKVKLEPGSPLFPSSRLTEEYDFWNFYFAGKSFLYHQVRYMVAALTLIGQGKLCLSDIQQLVDGSEDKNRDPIVRIVPADGLFLIEVRYLKEDLICDEKYDDDKIRRLEEELEKTIYSIKSFKGSICEKIELRGKLLQIESKLLRQRQINS